MTDNFVCAMCKALDRQREDMEKEFVQQLTRWCFKHADYSENSDLDPNPERIITLNSLGEFIQSLKGGDKLEVEKEV